MWWRQRWRNPVETSRMRRGHTFFFFDEWGHTFLSRTFVQTPHTQSEKWGVFVLCFVFADQKIKKMSGPQCCSNPPTLNPNSGAGHVEQLGGLSTYVSGSPNSKLAILLISDVYGTHLHISFTLHFFDWFLYSTLFSLQILIWVLAFWLFGFI